MFLTFRIFIFFFLLPLFFKSQSVQWCDSISYGGLNTIAGIEKDSLGNVYVGGSFEPTYHGEGTSGTFMSKYDASGNLLWSDTSMITETYGAAVSDMAVDKNGNSYLAGITWANIKFGSFLFQPIGHQDFFLVKYDPSGNVIWVKRVTGAGGVSSLAINGQGFIYLAGQCHNSITDSFNIPGPGFIAKYNTAGTCVAAVSYPYYFKQIISTTGSDLFVHDCDTNYYSNQNLEKIDADLNTIWSLKFYGISKLKADGTGNCYCMNDGGAIKVNALGVPQWTFTANPDDSLAYFGMGCDANTVYLTGYIGRYSANASHTLFVDHIDSAGVLKTRKKYYQNLVGTNLLIDGTDLYITGNTLSYGNQAFILKEGTIIPFVQDLTENLFYSVFPNPTSGIFNISCNGNDKFNVRIFNVFGQLIHNEQAVSKTSIDLNSRSKGIYYLEVVQNGKKATKKLLMD
jgi:hypothetical protein